jgi:hypothetical protein
MIQTTPVFCSRAFPKAGLDVHFEFVQDGEQLIHYFKSGDRAAENAIVSASQR